jgi:RNA polymerase sigma factor for flagellar operon FliA
MVDAYLPLVRLVAERIHRRLPPGIDLGSLIHSGIVGLLEALQRYDPKRGVAFQTYARYRIQGEIMEYLRSLDWVSRSVRAWGRRVTAARNRLAGRFGREASPEEMARELGVSLDEYYRVDQKVSDATLLSLEDLTIASEEEWKRAQEKFFHNPFQDPLICIEGKDLVQKLAVAIDDLPERERLVVTLYYHEELVTRLRQVLGEGDALAASPAKLQKSPKTEENGAGAVKAPAVAAAPPLAAAAGPEKKTPPRLRRRV